MNFTKHRVTEREMLSEMMNYCNNIISYRKQKDDKYSKMTSCISTRSGGVEVRKGYMTSDEELLIVIRYDVNNNFYYFLEQKEIGNETLENRIVINDKNDFYAYFDYSVDI